MNSLGNIIVESEQTEITVSEPITENLVAAPAPSVNSINSSNISHHHLQSQTTNNLKNEYKKLSWGQDYYEGNILINNLHGEGFYFTQQNGEKFFYDGLFYANKLEGYSQIFYDNGTHFQGLFRNHLRYGPGVLSYPNGHQDVGFWNGFKLIRLACGVGYNLVPNLATCESGKMKLLCNKILVPLSDNEENHHGGEKLDNNTLEEIGVNEEVREKMNEIFNLDIRNPNSLFFHRKFFDSHFYKQQNPHIIKVYSDDDDDDKNNNDEIMGEDDKNSENFDESLFLLERLENLKNKIAEVNETLQTFVAIKYSLQSRIGTCKSCCQRLEYTELLEEEILTSEEDISINKKEQSGLMEMPLFDASVGTVLGDDDLFVSSSELSDFSSIKPSSFINLTCSCDETEFKDGLLNLEEQLRNISSQETFYRNIRDELLKKVEKLNRKKLNKHENLSYKLIEVNELWAWNNESSLIELQKHCFKHRESEDMINFSVADLILGNRKDFSHAGAHEELCIRFLLACSTGKKNFVYDCLRENKIHPNLVDSRGNSGIFFAAAKNQFDIISTLTNFGAKLDQLNDEHLTPLSMCLLKYICVKNDCKDWEKAFLPESRKQCEIPELENWYRVKSLQSVTSICSNNSSCIDPDNPKQACSNLRIIDLFRRLSNPESKKAILPKKYCTTSFIFDISCQNSPEKKPDTLEDPFDNKLETIHLTILTLLDYGANPNDCEVPYPPLILGLFTENPDLVKEMIKSKANTDVLIDDNISCLHIAASLYPCVENMDICLSLLKAGCNPNSYASPQHWIEKRANFLGNVPANFEFPDLGKNPFHLLCMRDDFERDDIDYFCSLAKFFLHYGIDRRKFYLGHTFLSLAMIAGNIKLVQCLIKSGFNPYQNLEYGMGNILTLYTLERFNKILPLEKCKMILTTLASMNLNVLQNVYDQEYENAIVFAEDGDNFFKKFYEADAPASTKKIGKAAKPKVKKPDKKSQTYAIREFLKTLGRQTIIKQIEVVATEILFEFVEDGVINDLDISTILAYEYLTPQKAAYCLKKLFESRKIEHDRLNNDTIAALFDFINANKKPVKKSNKPVKTKKSQKNKSEEQEPSPSTTENVEAMVEEFNLKLNFEYSVKKFLLEPGLDDPERYNVCFHCLRGKDKELVKCPRCQMIQFCSIQCNKLNLKIKGMHGCNLMFYNMSPEEKSGISEDICLKDLLHSTKTNRNVKLAKLRESKLFEQERKLIDMWRADTYGTKFLQIKPLLDKAVVSSKKLNWNLGLLKDILERNFQRSPGETSLYSLEDILLKLHGKNWSRLLAEDKSDQTLRTKQSSTRRSTLGGSTIRSIIFQSSDLIEKPSDLCSCSRKLNDEQRNNKFTKTRIKTAKHTKEANKQFSDHLIRYMSDEDTRNKFDNLGEHSKPVRKTASPVIIKKLKKLPERYQQFLQVLAAYFPDTDFSSWLLPYACCSGGQLFYKFCYNDELFKESYSLS